MNVKKTNQTSKTLRTNKPQLSQQQTNTMHSKSRFVRQSRFDQTSFIGRLFFSYVYPLFFDGFRKNGLSLDDLDRCPKEDEVEAHAERLTWNWNQDKIREKPNFFWTLTRTFGSSLLSPILMNLIDEVILRIVQSLCLGVVIRYFAGETDITYRDAFYSAIGVCFCAAMNNIIFYWREMSFARIGIRARTACCSLIYQKALRLSQASLGKSAVGQIVNLMSNDVNRIELFVPMMPYLFSAPIQTVIAIYIVWTYLGIFCLFASGILLLLIPLQSVMAKLFSRIRAKTATLTDTRLRFMHEIVSGMRVIKMYCWEKPFADRIALARKSEISQIRMGCNLKAVNMSVFTFASQISLFACFVAYVLFGHTLTAEVVFVSITLFNAMKYSMTYCFPLAFGFGAELLISCQRIENFLMMEEIQLHKLIENVGNNLEAKENTKLMDSICKDRPQRARLAVNRVCAKWNSDLISPTLKDVSFKLEPGDLLSVIGPVGSGKSSLLMTLLGELPVESGDITRQGRLSYAGQSAWTFNDTVYNNILLGLDYDHRRYQKVVEVCALTRDMELWLFGDQTIVGEKGVQLSGGQKARIELARAVYREADIYLLDDPLSAVDTAVADHIFEKCILGHLQNKVRVLVTHQIQFIQKATKILVLKEGQALACGSFEELKELGVDFVSLLTESEDTKSTVETESSVISLLTSKKSFNKSEEKSKIKEETSESGSIKGRVYLEYFRAGATPKIFTVMVVFTVLSQASIHGTDLFLSFWTNKNQLGGKPQDQQTDITIYSVLVGTMFITSIIRAVSFYDICLRASENLHNQIFSRLMRTPISFFDTNPAGRIMNRFSKDLGLVDEMLVSTAFNLNRNLCQVFGMVVTICIVDWFMLLPSLVLAILSFYVRKLYIVSARDLRRFEGVARSPVFSQVATTLNGLVSIRAFGTQQSFQQKFNSLQNDHSSTFFLVTCSGNGLGFIIDWICFFYLSVVVTSAMLIPDQPGGSVGLLISSAVGLSYFISWTVRQTADFESQMTSVERIVEYQNLEQEASAESAPEWKPDCDWPAQGEIQFENLGLFYEDNKVLKNLNFSIRAGEKVGIVGRTGAGKSSMITALFRLTEPRGVIRIDGVDIQSIGLDDLRQKISIIPQDPVIYSGTIRYNLDPFSQYADSSLWEALDQVQLKATVTNLEGQLEARLNDSGSNLSVGQRQLICLARAILRRNQILVLDEATANIDHQTDSLIQCTLRSQFVHCTVLTIAHRLNSIIDSDRVLVLDAGQIIEFDSPYLLLQQQNSFHEMCLKTGPSMYAHLFREAKLAYQSLSLST